MISLTSLGLIAYINMKGIQYVNIDDSNTRKIKFEFEDTPEVQEAINEFHNGQWGLYADSIKDIKAKIHFTKGKKDLTR